MRLYAATEVQYPSGHLNLREKMPESTWQQQLAHVVKTIDELCALLDIRVDDLPISQQALQQFSLRVPHSFVARIQKQNPKDPLLLQVLPVQAEIVETPGYQQDPLQEAKFTKAPGLLHKYQGRVLFTLAGSCAINCRYCFRRHFPYADNVGLKHWPQSLAYIAADTSIHEVILSGGDPLVLKDQQLAQLIAELENIPHVQRIRVHTRLPIVIPARVTESLVAMLAQTRLQSVVVLHANHANELSQPVMEALQRLRQAGIPLLNQSVLLHEVNDDVVALKTLSERLFASGVIPYYLHLLDPVTGTAHFAVTKARAQQLMAGLTAQLPGYLVPKLAQEIPERAAKTVIA